jgi:hypothetical protein
MSKKTFDPHTDLDAARWPNMSLNELYDQEIVLQSRIDFAAHIGNTPLQEQMTRGMGGLQALIKNKNDGEDDAKVTVIDPYSSSTTIDRGRT